VNDALRLDVYLDVACLVKTRSQAKELCDAGKIEVNGARAKAHRGVRVGDRIQLSLQPGHRREVVVRELVATHVAKQRARELYDDVTPPPSAEELEMRALERFAPPLAPPRGAGRPEKRDRRKIERIRGR
jgi:ribosome-associated heat shock protein Hsp15